MQFVDQVTIRVRGGDGGNGCLSFRRTKHNPRGGPDGGNGGRGGNVVAVVDPHLTTLLELRFPKALFEAGRGAHGGSNDKHGRRGADLELRVPYGTTVTDVETGEVLATLSEPERQRLEPEGGDERQRGDGPAELPRCVVARGGYGGRGNASFKSPTRRAPRLVQKGREGEERTIRLDLHLLADAGLVGLPNAGKSTLLARLSAARPLIADFPFSTKVPILGVVDAGGDESFVLADLPGLIEGAHRGVGLGHRFLRHVERAGVLVQLVDFGGAEDALEAYRHVHEELRAYRAGLEQKPRLLVPTKMDLAEARERLAAAQADLEALGHPIFPISAATGEGLPALVRAIYVAVRAARSESAG